jgi:hypothetical protein
MFVLFVHQCNIHFLFFIIRRHVSASHGHLQVLYSPEAGALLCHFFPIPGCQPCAPADDVLIVSVRVLEYLCCLCGRHVAATKVFYIVFLVLYAMRMLVFFNKLLIILFSLPMYVNV